MTTRKPTVFTNIGRSLGPQGEKLLKRMAREGFEIASESNANAALKRVKKKAPDIFLLNPNKPRMSGLSFCAKLKKVRRLTSVPVVFITDKASSEEIVQAFEAGAADYITGPFRQAEILARLRSHLSRASAGQPDQTGVIEELYATLNALPALLIELDAKGQIYTLCSRQPNLAYALLPSGHPKTVNEILPENPALVLMDAIGQVKETGDRATATCHVETVKGAGWVEFNITAKSPGPSGSKDRFVVLVQDITERKRAAKERSDLEEMLRQEQKMEGIGRLAGGISHSMNDVLGAIMGLASSFRVELDPASPALEDLEQIIHACRKGYELTSKLLSLASEVSFTKERLSLNAMVDEARELLDMAISKGIAIETDLDPECADFIGDPVMINHVFINLALNAADAMPEGGTLTFSTRSYFPIAEDLADIPDLAPGRYVILQVSDTGEGMLPTVRERAFEPFFTTKSQSKGTGLGLPMVYGIIKSHGGRISINSEVGEGTTVTVFLPAFVAEDEEIEPQEALKSVPAETRTLLVVDDDELVLFAHRRILQRLGYTVVTAQGGAEALMRYEEHGDKISLVLLDLVMPEMDGAMTFKHLKEMDPDVNVLLCTSHFNEEVTNKLIEHGVKGVLLKPFEMEELSDKIEASLE